jgi:hypothetical protein
MKKLLVLATAVTALALAGAGAAAAADGAAVVRDEGCVPIMFGPVVLGTACTVTNTTTNTVTTKSGVTSYATNGTVDYTLSLVWGDTLTRSSEIHTHNLLKDGEFVVSSDRYREAWESVSGTYHLSCVEGYDIHWANGASQFGDFVLECTVL